LFPLRGWVLLGALACAQAETRLDANFRGSSGIAVANKRLFVANGGEDSLQVLALGDKLADVAFVRGPVQFFPLRIPTGANPGQLAASADGKSIIVAELQGRLRTVDSETLRSVSTVRISGGPIVDLIEDAVACVPPCAGRFLVAADAAVSEWTLLVDGAWQSGASWGLERTPASLVADNSWLFVSQGTDVVRIHRASGVQTVLDAGGQVGPVALAGPRLLVGRVDHHDVVVADTATLQLLALDPVFAPLPTCVDVCGEQSCQRGHAADRSLCLEGATLSAAGTAYAGLYLGAAPALIMALDEPLQAPACAGEEATHDGFALATSLDGLVHFLTLGETPALLDRRWCEAVSIGKDAATGIAIDELVGDCLPVPAARRFACVDGVGLFPGRLHRKALRLDWEGVLLSRPAGGGTATAEGALTDSRGDFVGRDVRAGDVVAVLGQPEGTCAGEPLCTFERRVAAVLDDRLTLDAALPADCFPGEGGVAYEVRAGDAFLAQVGAGKLQRIAPGQTFGLGGDVATDQAVRFRLRALEVGAQLPACARYTDGTTLHKALRRDRPLSFTIDDPFEPFRTGYLFSGNKVQTQAAGELPADMILSPVGAGGPTVFVAYAGSSASTVLAFRPFDLDHLYEEGESYTVVR
jgi:hypothetical protein